MNTFEISKRIKEIREKRGMSRPVFDRVYGISETTQQRYENGKLPESFLDTLSTYHDAGNVSYDYLLDGKEQSLEDAELFYEISFLSVQQKELVKGYISYLKQRR